MFQPPVQAADAFSWHHLIAPTNPAEFWTLALVVATVGVVIATLALVVVARRGLASLTLTRQDMQTRATRESRALAIKRAEDFSRMIKIDQLALRTALVEAKIRPFTQDLQSGVAIFDDDAMYKPAKAWWVSVPAPTQSQILYFLNDLEAWAMVFTGALAESDVVFGPCAPTYCSIVLQYSPWIIVCRKEQFSGYYPNILKLFHAWRAELEVKDKGSKTEAALRAAHAAEERLAQHQLPAVIGK